MSILSIVENYSEDLAFQWLMRCKAIHSPNQNLESLRELDESIEANIDGLFIARDTGWGVCMDALKSGAMEDLFPATILAVKNKSQERMQTIQELLLQTPESLASFSSAMAWVSFPEAQFFAQAFLQHASPILRLAGLTVFALHRQDPGLQLGPLLEVPEATLRARALRAAGELGRVDVMPQLRTAERDDDPACAFWASWSATLLGDEQAAESLRAFLRPESPFAHRALQVALPRLGLVRGRVWQEALADRPETLRLSIQAVGILGDPAFIPWLFDQMEIPSHARVAGEAYSFITGADLAYEELEGDAPEGFESGPTEDPADENVDLDPDEDLPWPHRQRIQKHWDKVQGTLAQGLRHLLGKPIDAAHLQDVLRTGFQRQRRAAALELSIRHPGLPLFEVRAPGFRQIGELVNSLPLSPQHTLPRAEEDWRTAMLRGAREEEARRARA